MTISRLDDPVRLTVVGVVDVSTRDGFRDALADLSGTLGDVRLDMAGVPFIDTHGVTLVVFTADRLRQEGGRLIVHRPPDSLTRIFETLWSQDGAASLYFSGTRGKP